MNLCLDLFLTFARIGVCTFGGGYAMLPILQREVVDKKGWCTVEDLADYYAIGQCTPGVIAVNTATFVGTKLKGNLGGVFATLGVAFPSTVIILAIASFLNTFASFPLVQHAFAGVRACVCALILSSVLKLWKKTVVDKATLALFTVIFLLNASAGVLTGAASGAGLTALAAVLDTLLSPVVLVAAAGLCGLTVRKSRGWAK